jgi:integrase
MNSDGSSTKANGTELDERDILAPDEVRRLLAHTDAGFGYTLILTAVLTGMRHDELLALAWGDIELTEPTAHLYVRRSLSWAKAPGEAKGKPRFYEPKAHSRRTLPLPAELVQQLRRWKLQCPPSELNLVFPTALGRLSHRSNILRGYLYPALRRAELRQVDMHSLRHTFASALILAGSPVTEVQHLLGHSNPTTTLKVYSHWFKKIKTDAVSNLARNLGVGAGPAAQKLVKNGVNEVSKVVIGETERAKKPTFGQTGNRLETQRFQKFV